MLERPTERTGVVARLYRRKIGRLEYGREEIDVIRLVLRDLLEKRTDVLVACLVETVLVEFGKAPGVEVRLQVLESECVVEISAFVGRVGGVTLPLD